METVTKAFGTAMVEFEVRYADGRPSFYPTGKVKIGERWVRLCPDCLERMSPAISVGSG